MSSSLYCSNGWRGGLICGVRLGYAVKHQGSLSGAWGRQSFRNALELGLVVLPVVGDADIPSLSDTDLQLSPDVDVVAFSQTEQGIPKPMVSPIPRHRYEFRKTDRQNLCKLSAHPSVQTALPVMTIYVSVLALEFRTETQFGLLTAPWDS
jgi:hypothetical protein